MVCEIKISNHYSQMDITTQNVFDECATWETKHLLWLTAHSAAFVWKGFLGQLANKQSFGEQRKRSDRGQNLQPLILSPVN
jgi:hypothetical protein